MLFVKELFFTVASYQFFENEWIAINHGFLFEDNVLYNSTISNF